jgi:hypothetical protein
MKDRSRSMHAVHKSLSHTNTVRNNGDGKNRDDDDDDFQDETTTKETKSKN